MRIFLATLFVISSILFAEERLPLAFKGQLFNCLLTSKIYGDGFSLLEFCGLPFGSFVGTRLTLTNRNGEQIRCREEPLQNIACFLEQGNSGESLAFTSIRLVKDPSGNIYAEVRRRFYFSEKGIEMQVTLTAKQDFLLESSRKLSDLMIIPTKSLIGAIVTVTTMSTHGSKPQAFDTLIPDVYCKDSWGMKGDFERITLRKNAGALTVAAGNNSTVAINHYGGVDIEILSRPKLIPAQLRFRKGSTVTWSSILEFMQNDD